MKRLTSRVMAQSVRVDIYSHTIFPLQEDEEDYLTLAAATSLCILCMLSTYRKRVVRFGEGVWGYGYRMHSHMPLYFTDRILKKNETCCLNNPYKIKIAFDSKHKPTTCSPEDIQNWLDMMQKNLPHPDYPLHPFMSKEINESMRTNCCPLCNSELNYALNGECEGCCLDILTFLEIMHSPSLWMPVGWGQHISHPIPSLFCARTSSIEEYRFSVDVRGITRQRHLTDIRTFLAASMGYCNNQLRVAPLEMICIRNICRFMKGPCPDREPVVFLDTMKKSPHFPQSIVEIFKNTIELFHNTQLNICPPNTTHINDDYYFRYFCHVERKNNPDHSPFALTNDQVMDTISVNTFPPSYFHI